MSFAKQANMCGISPQRFRQFLVEKHPDVWGHVVRTRGKTAANTDGRGSHEYAMADWINRMRNQAVQDQVARQVYADSPQLQMPTFAPRGDDIRQAIQQHENAVQKLRNKYTPQADQNYDNALQQSYNTMQGVQNRSNRNAFQRWTSRKSWNDYLSGDQRRVRNATQGVPTVMQPHKFLQAQMKDKKVNFGPLDNTPPAPKTGSANNLPRTFGGPLQPKTGVAPPLPRLK